MRLEDYTPDTICRAMRLPGFGDDPALLGSDPALRLLLQPSFDPEVCVTLLAGATQDRVEVRTFPELFWHQPSPAHRPAVFTESAMLERGTVVDLARDFVDTARLMDEPGRKRWAVLDGMPVAAAGRHGGADRELDLNVGAADEFRQFVARVIRRLHPALPTGRCRNGLALAGRYVDLRLKADALPPVDTSTRVMILGDEAGRREVADRLDRERRPGSGERGNDGSP